MKKNDENTGVAGSSDSIDDSSKLGRRNFLKGVGIAAGAAAITSVSSGSQSQERNAKKSNTPRTHKLTLTINGKKAQHSIDPRTTLVDLLREQLSMTGTKKGCDHGACGACTVHVNGQRVLSCLTLAATMEGAEVKTIEGLASGEDLHSMQEAFLRCDAYQCGYCTPGQIMSAVACIEEGYAKGSAEETREWMSGNLCRCSAYPNILAAVRQTSGAEPVGDPAAKLASAEIFKELKV